MSFAVGHEFEVYFATNRNMTGSNSAPSFGERFHRDGANFYRVGRARVRKVSDDLDDGYEVVSVRTDAEGTRATTAHRLGSKALFADIKGRMIAETCDAIVYLHGFANTFEDGIKRAAQLHEAYEITPRDGGAPYHPVVLAFCWPSNGSTTPPWEYFSDRDDAKASGTAMARAVMRFVDFMADGGDPCRQRIHVVAHSMGNWALRHTVQGLKEFSSGSQLAAIFDNVFLMAADEDDDSLEHDHKLRPLCELARRVHVYHSADDGALVISDKTKFNPDRLGYNGLRTFSGISTRVVAVDCEAVDDTEVLQVNHQYYRRRPEVIADVRQVLSGTRPDAIAGHEVVEPGRRYRIRAG